MKIYNMKLTFEEVAESGLTVYRCHDVWDRYPQIGIRCGHRLHAQPRGRKRYMTTS